MAIETQFYSFEQISAKLRQLCTEGSTGTLSLATDENHHATISLKEGHVIGAAYRHFKGENAVDKIRHISAAKCSFASGVLRPNNSEDTALTSFEKLLDAPAPAATGPVGAPSSNNAGNGQIQKLIQDEATEFLGPMAATICAEYCAAAGDLGATENLQVVLDRIAEEVGDTDKGNRFKQNVLGRMKSQWRPGDK